MEGVREPAAVCVLQAHRGEVTCADGSGGWLATGGGDGALRLWRWQRGAGWLPAVGEPRAHRYGVTATRWAPTGVLLASAGVDGAARVWAARSLRARGSLAAPHAAAARSLCWATSERLLVGYDDGAVRAWRVRDAALLACVRALEGAVYALTTFGGATLLLAGCTEGVLKIFNLVEVCGSGTESGPAPTPLLWEDGAHDLGALCAASSTCERAAATGGRDARVRLWRVTVAGGTAAGGVLSGHGGAVTSLCWARGAALLVSASLDRTARVWDVAAATCLRVLPAHPRYLTCVAVPQNVKYIVTGSNDKTIRTWSLSTFSIDDDAETQCSPLEHFGLGDLVGIGPVDDDILLDGDDDDSVRGEGEGAACAWRGRGHGGAVNCVTSHGVRLATACSDGAVRIFTWSEEDAMLHLEKTLGAHRYPVLSVDFGADGALLLSAGLDGRACLWDVETGCELASLWAAGAAGGGEGEGGGGVRGARVSPHRPPLLLLAADAGVAALWTIDGAGSDPVHVYPEAEGGAACTCAAWTADGALAAVGGAGGALQLLAPPPAPVELCRFSHAHDLGVLSCDFAPDEVVEEEGGHEEVEEPVRRYLLATGGMDESVKLWVAEVSGARGSLELCSTLAAHGGAVHCVRWGARGVLATAGADRWARVWRVSRDRERRAVSAAQVAAVPAGGAGGAPGAAFLGPGLLAVGALAGRLALWRLPEPATEGEVEKKEDDAEPRWWGQEGVLRWLAEYVTASAGEEEEEVARLATAVHASSLNGARLMDEPLDQLLEIFGYSVDKETVESECEAGLKSVRARLLEELQWLRRPPFTYEEELRVPHALLCALSHAVPRWPVRASDGYTYEQTALAHWYIAAGAVSPVSGRRLRGAVAPNLGVLRALRLHLAAATTIPQ